MKSLGAKWLVRMSEYFIKNPLIVVNGFHAAGIPQSIDAGRPVMEDEAEPTDETESDEEIESEDNYDEDV